MRHDTTPCRAQSARRNVETRFIPVRGHQYDEHPVGFIIFTADWRVLALVTASERANDETARALFDRMMAYSGRYRMRVDGCFITIVDSAWYPAWIGTEQTNFFTLDGDTLSIISPLLQHPKFPNDRVRGVAIWRKE